MIEVTLTPIELNFAYHLGKLRYQEAKAMGCKDQHGFTGDPFAINIIGAQGEMAVAKALDVYFLPTINTFKTQRDVGEYEVRTRTEYWHELIIRKDDADHKFILVTGKEPVFRIRGWIQASEAKRPEFLKTHGNREPAYFIPHQSLKEVV